MLKSYKATYVDGKIYWLDEQPHLSSAHILVTVLEEIPLPSQRRSPPTAIAGKGRTLGNIVSPLVNEEDWECLK